MTTHINYTYVRNSFKINRNFLIYETISVNVLCAGSSLMKTDKVPILEIFVPKAAMFGMRNVFCVLFALCHLPNFISGRPQCSNSTFPSHVLGGCVDCPDRPKINCKNEDINDIIWCLKSCMKGKYNHIQSPRMFTSIYGNYIIYNSV